MNVCRHGGASRAAVRLGRRDGCIELAVGDDGVGFDADATAAHGTGLASMRERAQLLGGTLHVRSAHGEGTEVVARIPAAEGEA